MFLENSFCILYFAMEPCTKSGLLIRPEDGWVTIGDGFQVRAIRESVKQNHLPPQDEKSDLLTLVVDKTNLDEGDPITYSNPVFTHGRRELFQHQCHYCTRVFMTYDFTQMRTHLQSHAKIGCGYCDGRFHTIQQCVWHRLRVHDISSFQTKSLGFLYICKCCHLGLSTEERIYDHLKKCHLNYIRKEFPKSLAFLDEDRAPTPDDTLRHFCKPCDLIVSETIHIAAHHAWHKQKPRAEPHFRCPRCPEDFTVQKQYALHLINHVVEQRDTSKDGHRYVCLYCQRDYANFYTLKDHITRKHAVLNPYRCLYCPCEFPNADIHREHNRTCHGVVRPAG